MTLEEHGSRIGAFIAECVFDPIVFERLVRDVFEFQFENNPPYRAFCQARKVSPNTLPSLEQIPAIPTSGFKDLELSVLLPALRTTVFYSSGTTAQRPSRHFHSPETLKLYEKSLLKWFKPYVLPDLDHARFIILAPPPARAPHSSLVHMFQAVSAEFGGDQIHFCSGLASDGSWALDFKTVLDARLKLASSEQPVVVCGTAFSFVHLCDYLAENGLTLSLPPNSRVFETGGYKGRSRSISKEELHKLISDRLLIPKTHIITEYGMSELSSQAYDRQTGDASDRIFHFPPWARATIISPETGNPVSDCETGLIRVLDLANVGSVMAIQTEDLARRNGSGFELLGRAKLAEARGCSLLQVNS